MSAAAYFFIIIATAVGAYLYGRADNRHDRDQELVDLQYQNQQLHHLLDKTQEAVVAKDQIIHDLVDHGDTLNRELDETKRRLRASGVAA